MSRAAPSSKSHGSAPGVLLQVLEARAFAEHYAAIVMCPILNAAPRGDGHPVLVLPGLAAGDATTAILRRFLKSRGYAASGWGQGLNLGCGRASWSARTTRCARYIASMDVR